MFELNKDEFEALRCNFSTSKRGGTRYMPFAFTEHGVTMLASVLNSDRAIDMNIAIVRAFISIRHYLNTQYNLAEKINEIRLELKTRIDEHDIQLSSIYDALENLLDKKQDDIEAKENWNKRQNESIECFQYDEKNKVILLYPESFDISELEQIWIKLILK